MATTTTSSIPRAAERGGQTHDPVGVERDGIGILLQHGFGELVGAGRRRPVDHLEATVAQRPGDEIGAGRPTPRRVRRGGPGHDDSKGARHARDTTGMTFAECSDPTRR